MKTLRYLTKEEMNSNVYQLFNRTFPVRVSYIDTLNRGFIQDYGYISSGDPNDDRMNANEKVLLQITIDKMLDYFRKQIPFYLTDKSNERIIYNIIHQHLIEWGQFVEQNKGLRFQLDKVPYQDLKDLSALASMLYRVRDRDRDVDYAFNQVHNTFKTLGLISVADIMKPTEEVKRTEEVAPHVKDTSILDEVFANRNRR